MRGGPEQLPPALQYVKEYVEEWVEETVPVPVRLDAPVSVSNIL